MNKKNKKNKKGVTLIELMIVIAVAGILAAVAWPSYQSTITRGYRTTAIAFMLTVKERQERYKGHAATYSSSLADLELGNGLIAEGRYQISITGFDADNNLYTIKATPRNAQANDPCKILELTSKGERSLSGSPTLSKEKCWTT